MIAKLNSIKIDQEEVKFEFKHCFYFSWLWSQHLENFPKYNCYVNEVKIYDNDASNNSVRTNERKYLEFVLLFRPKPLELDVMLEFDLQFILIDSFRT